MRLLVILLTALLLPKPALAATPEALGLAIAEQAEASDRGWGDVTAALSMTLRNANGLESQRELRVQILEVTGDGDRSLTLFDTPRDIAGTAFLSYTHALTPDDQWLYLPALKRVKRIASANKSGPFMGSEFAYEDLTSDELAKYHYTLLRTDTLEGRAVDVVEQQPQYANSGYTRRVVWLDQAMHQALKIEFYNRGNALLKTLTLSDYAQYLGQYWRASRLHMVNHQSGKETDLVWRDYQFRTGLSLRDFDQNTLKRSR